MLDADGFGLKDKASVTVLGGFLGQVMLVLNTVARYYSRLDVPSKSSASSRHASQRPKSSASAVVADGDDTKSVGSANIQHKILDPKVIQKFLYDFIFEKLKTERLPIQVDPSYVEFLNNLPHRLELNEMRTMKEPNYT